MLHRGAKEGDIVGAVQPSRVAQGKSALLIRAWSLVQIQSRLPWGISLTGRASLLQGEDGSSSLPSSTCGMVKVHPPSS